jgi:hypothetical protein
MSYTQFVPVGTLLQTNKAKPHLNPSRSPVKTTDVMYNTNTILGSLSFAESPRHTHTHTHTHTCPLSFLSHSLGSLCASGTSDFNEAGDYEIMDRDLRESK